MSILITGGTGYIGSHAALHFIVQGHQVVLFDNLSNSNTKVVDTISDIAGKPIAFVEGDIRDQKYIENILQHYQCSAVIHFAGLKAVGESVDMPLRYFDNNINGSISLFNAMQNCAVTTLVFSSSATVYGNPHYFPIDENHPLQASNPYGRSKIHIEQMLEDIAACGTWRIANLRYFNPAGAHSSGLLGESPQGVPNNLMPYIAQTAAGIRKHVSIFGNDYLTKDGTGVRDYIHIEDLAAGHVAALEYVQSLPPQKTTHCFNLGTGQGYSVQEVIEAFSAVSKKNIPTVIAPRRKGDVAICYAAIDKAAQQLKWRATRQLHDMCQSTWAWQQNQR